MNKREQILAAAFKMFAQHGFHGTYTRMIAQEAGASLSAIPYYFGTKEVLFQEVSAIAGQNVLDYLSPYPDLIEDKLEEGSLSKKEAKELLYALFNRHINYAFDPANADTVQIIREVHTVFIHNENAGFGTLYNKVSIPMAKLIAYITGIDDFNEALIWSWNLIGEPLFFNYHKGFALYAFSQEDYSEENQELIRKVAIKKLECALNHYKE